MKKPDIICDYFHYCIFERIVVEYQTTQEYKGGKYDYAKGIQ
jgi:hypothetical protein